MKPGDTVLWRPPWGTRWEPVTVVQEWKKRDGTGTGTYVVRDSDGATHYALDGEIREKA